ncbi:unnamed protein product [Toxocara canis]|nr:unnamed protein product [Toxocara canis]
MDYWGMLQTHSVTEVLRARIFDLEDMLQHVMQIEKKTGKQASILYVMDLTGLKYNRRLYHLVVGPLRSLAEFMSVHYVELIKYFVLVNVPSFVYALWTAVRPLLPDRTRDKVRILSSSDWRHEILEYANAESLPDKWNSPDENIFTSPIELPMPFDENNYCNDNFKIPEGATKIRVAAGKFCYVIRELEAGERLSWWLTGDADFGFGVFFTDDRNESDHTVMETIYPCFGWMPGPLIVPLQDSIIAEKKGFYKILFTNTRAWWHTLTVTLAVHTDTA